MKSSIEQCSHWFVKVDSNKEECKIVLTPVYLHFCLLLVIRIIYSMHHVKICHYVRNSFSFYHLGSFYQISYHLLSRRLTSKSSNLNQFLNSFGSFHRCVYRRPSGRSNFVVDFGFRFGPYGGNVKIQGHSQCVLLIVPVLNFCLNLSFVLLYNTRRKIQ